MKQIIIAVLITFGFFSACNNSGKKSELSKTWKSDTTRRQAVYIDFERKPITPVPELLWMVVQNKFEYRNVDSTTQKKQWFLDSTFFVPRLVPDKDSSGKKHIEGFPIMRELVSLDPNYDSAVAILNRWINNHQSLFPKNDTVVVKKQKK